MLAAVSRCYASSTHQRFRGNGPSTAADRACRERERLSHLAMSRRNAPVAGVFLHTSNWLSSVDRADHGRGAAADRCGYSFMIGQMNEGAAATAAALHVACATSPAFCGALWRRRSHRRSRLRCLVHGGHRARGLRICLGVAFDAAATTHRRLQIWIMAHSAGFGIGVPESGLRPAGRTRA